MNKLLHIVGAAIMSFFAFCLEVLGGWDASLTLLVVLMALDMISGIVVAFLHRSGKTASGSFRSASLFLGITKKFFMFILVILGASLDKLLHTDICRITVIGFYSANEAFSIIENAALAGVPFPKGLLNVLDVYRQKKDNTVTGSNQEGES